MSLTIKHVTIQSSKYTTTCHLLNNLTTLEEVFDHNNMDNNNLLKFFKHIDLANKI